MTDRRYNEDEVAAIFAKAAEGPQLARPHSPGSEGLTLAELQEIGREVGISPDAVALAAQSIALPAPPAPGRFFGLPISVERSVAIDRRLSNDEWEKLVVELRQVFNARGTLRVDGSLRQWTNGNLQALLEPTATGQRLRLRTLNGAARTWMSTGLATIGISAVTAIAVGINGHLGNAAPGILFLVSMGVGLFANGALRLPKWARLRSRQMEAIATSVALPSGSTPSELPPPPRD